MDKKITLALLALLGFSTACSTVKNSAKSKDQAPSATEQPTTVVMYGVPNPDIIQDNVPNPNVTQDDVPTQEIALPEAPEQSAETPADEGDAATTNIER